MSFLFPLVWALSSSLSFVDSDKQQEQSDTRSLQSPERESGPSAELANSRSSDPGDTSPGVLRLRRTPSFVFGVLWDVSVPLGASREFIDQASAGGFSFEGRVRLAGPWGVGMLFGWHQFQQKSVDTTELGGSTFSGRQIRELASTQIIGHVHYLALGPGRVGPHLALGAGVSHRVESVQGPTYQTENDRWVFTVVPELGLEAPVGQFVGMFDVRLSISPPNANLPVSAYASACLGLGFP